MAYNLPAGLLAFGAGADAFGGGAPVGVGGAFGSVLGAISHGAQADQRSRDSQLQDILDIARFEQEIRAAEEDRALQQQALAEAAAKQQAQQAYVQSLPPELQALGGAFPQVLAKQQAEQAFAGQMTQDQMIDNQLARERFQAEQALAQQKFGFEQRKFDVGQQAKQDALGRLKPETARFYVGQVGKINKDLDNAVTRYTSATKSLQAGNATGDKAALMHMARLISDEALQEADVQRMVSEGVMPSWFESGWNAVRGKAALSDETRRDMHAQLGREMDARFGAYQENRGYLAGSFAPEVLPSERQRVLGKERTNPVVNRGTKLTKQSSNPADYSIEELLEISRGQ